MNMRRPIIAVPLLSLTIFYFVAAPSAFAEVNAGLKTVGQRDKNFAHEAARGLMRDARIASLAREHAGKKQIKNFLYYVAQRRVHADAALRRLVAESNATLPTKLDAQQQQELDRLQKMRGAEFDKAALRAISEPKYLQFFESEINAPAPEVEKQVQAYARQQLPIVRKDAEAARRWLDGYDRI